MKEILIIQVYRHLNGNASKLVSAFSDGTKYAGHEIEIISLVKTNLSGVLHDNVMSIPNAKQYINLFKRRYKFFNDQTYA